MRKFNQSELKSIIRAIKSGKIPMVRGDSNQSELKSIIRAIKGGKIPMVRGDFTPPTIGPNRRAAWTMVQSILGKAGLDLVKANKLLAEDQKALRAAFDKERAAAARQSRASTAAFRSGMAARLEALKLLRAPFLPSLLTLEKPFLIFQLPNPQSDILIDSRVEPNNSSIRILVNTNRGSDGTSFVFFFFWANESEFAAVVNVASSLIVNGGCSVQAHPGIFSGHIATLNVGALLRTIRWSGWGTDPVTGEHNDQTPHPDFQSTQFQQVTGLFAKGGHVFEGADFKSQSFSFQQFPLSHSLLVVPGRASVVFQVSLELNYRFDEGDGDIEDNITVDFSKNGNVVVCPNLVLEVLTPLPGLTATQTLGSFVDEEA